MRSHCITHTHTHTCARKYMDKTTKQLTVSTENTLPGPNVRLMLLLETGIITCIYILPPLHMLLLSFLLSPPSLLQLTSFISPLVFVSCLITFLVLLTLHHFSTSLATVKLKQMVQLYRTNTSSLWMYKATYFTINAEKKTGSSYRHENL